jgi:cell division transport system permease protein
MTIAAVITVAACLFMVAASFSLATNLDYLLQQMETYMNIIVYVRDDATDDAVNALERKISDIPHVTQMTYVSANDALLQFKENLGSSNAITDGLDEDNPLPRSFVLEIDTLANQSYVMNRLEELQNQGIDVIKHGGPAVNAFMTINNALRVISIILITGLGILSIVIIFNTIRIAVNARKNEINIMKYVGATDSFIRWPFLMEGMIIGLLGALIPSAIGYFVYTPLMDLIKSNLPMLSFEFRLKSHVFSILFPLLFFLGIAIGAAGSGTSIRRHLHV